MAHPYQSSREKHPGQAKAHDRVKGYARGGAAKFGGGKSFGKTMDDNGDVAVPGKKGRNKFARGGKAKKGGNHVNIAIVNPRAGGDKGGAAMGGPPPVGGAPALPPPGLGAGAPPPGGPPMMPPPGGPPPGTMKRGGKVGMTAGADSGVGRKQKARAASTK